MTRLFFFLTLTALVVLVNAQEYEHDFEVNMARTDGDIDEAKVNIIVTYEVVKDMVTTNSTFNWDTSFGTDKSKTFSGKSYYSSKIIKYTFFSLNPLNSKANSGFVNLRHINIKEQDVPTIKWCPKEGYNLIPNNGLVYELFKC